MENNINLRNQYIQKVQGRVDKLLYSINLLNNLNEVITQKGGNNSNVNGSSGSSTDNNDLNDLNLDEVSKYLSDNEIDLGQYFMTSVEKIEILEKGIDELNDQIKASKEALEKNGSTAQIENAKLVEQVSKLTTDLEKLKSELEKEKEKTTKCTEELGQLTISLESYKKQLGALLMNMPPKQSVDKHNDIIDELIKRITYVSQIETYLQKKDIIDNSIIIEIYNLLNKDAITQLLEELSALKYNDTNTGKENLTNLNTKKSKLKEITNNPNYKNIINYAQLIANLLVYMKIQKTDEIMPKLQAFKDEISSSSSK